MLSADLTALLWLPHSQHATVMRLFGDFLRSYHNRFWKCLSTSLLSFLAVPAVLVV